jgi:hypothetical protein
VKVSYTEASQLEPTFHALTTFAKGSDILTGAQSLATSAASVTASNGTISVEKANNQPVSIYNIAGILIHTATGNTSCTAAPGTYIVRIGTAATKLTLK